MENEIYYGDPTDFITAIIEHQPVNVLVIPERAGTAVWSNNYFSDMTTRILELELADKASIENFIP